jgi:hypothetical protein
MRQRRFLIVSSVMCVFAFIGFGGVAFGAPPDGMYVGTTDQGRDFEVRVSGGRVDQWMINFSVSCAYGSASGGVRTTISPSCAIESDGSFVCGLSSCPYMGVNSRVTGRFYANNTVTGTVDVAAKIGGGCCYLNTAFSATHEGGGGGGGGGGGAFDYFVAAIAHTPGVGDALWRSKLGVLNFSGASAEVELSYIHGGNTTTKTEVIAHGELKTWDDAAVSLFGISSRSSGPVFINSTQPLVITSRTYNEGEDGTFGSFLSGVVQADGVGQGETAVLSQLCGNNDFRTNVGVVNLTDEPCQVRVQVRSAIGTLIGSPVNLTLDPRGFEQINDVFAATGAGSRNNAYAKLNVQTDGCEVWGYGSVIDGVAAHPGTDDATIIPMSRIESKKSINSTLTVMKCDDFRTTDSAKALSVAGSEKR